MDGLINGNSISGIALTCFSIIIGGIVTIVVQQLQIRAKQNEAKEAAITAAKSADEAKANTQNVSNGFANRMDRKLDNIATNQEELSRAFRDHLEWHLNKET